jgi:hypothetical protein
MAYARANKGPKPGPDRTHPGVTSASCILEMYAEGAPPTQKQTRLPRVLLYNACKHVSRRANAELRACTNSYSRDPN